MSQITEEQLSEIAKELEQKINELYECEMGFVLNIVGFEDDERVSYVGNLGPDSVIVASMDLARRLAEEESYVPEGVTVN